MGKPVEWDEIDNATPRAVTVGVASVELAPTRLGRNRRKQIVITPITAGVTCYLCKGDTPAVASQGIPLAASQAWVESEDNGVAIYQGAYQIIANGAGTVTISEVFAP